MRLFITLFLFFILAGAFAAPTPFQKDIDNRFKVIESMLGIDDAKYLPKVRAGFSSGIRTVVAEYIPQLDSGASAADHALGVSIPASSMIVNAFYNVPVQFVSSNATNQTVAVKCESAGDIIAAVDLTQFGDPKVATRSYIGAVSDFATNSFRSDGCELTATVGSAASGNLIAGELEIFVQYVETASSSS